MRFFYPNERVVDVKYGASLRSILAGENKPYKCLLLTIEVDEYMNEHGLGEYIAYRKRVVEALCNAENIDVVDDYPQLGKQNESRY